MCNRCYQRVLDTMPEETIDDPTFTLEDDVRSSSQAKDVINLIINALKLPSIQLESISHFSASQRYSAMKTTVINIMETLVPLVEEIYQAPSPALQGKTVEETLNLAADNDELLDQLERKLIKSKSLTESKRWLTLLSPTMTIEKTLTRLGPYVTEYLVREAKQLRIDKGILPDIAKKQASNSISKLVLEKVLLYYRSDHVSRPCPGMNDFVIVRGNGEKVKTPKRLLLYNLREIHQQFLEENPEVKIGLAKFSSQRPQECIFPNCKGVHSSCTCIYHQNVKLMIEAISPTLTYRILMGKLVCSVENEKCMLYQLDQDKRCEECPSSTALINDLNGLCQDTHVTYSQWQSTDRTTVQQVTEKSIDFTHSLVWKLQELCKHHFIAVQQTEHVKRIQETMTTKDMLIKIDFAQNYLLVNQNSPQIAYFDPPQATLHPAVVYTKSKREPVESSDDEGSDQEDLILNSESYCFISDYLKHDVNAVFHFQTKLIEELKLRHPEVENLIFFSDGGPAHYKNFKNLSNLSQIFPDFKLRAEWNFCATCHGKCCCDGIASLIKRLARDEAMRRFIDGHLSTPFKLYEWAVQAIPKIKFFYCSEEEIQQTAVVSKLESRYDAAIKIKGVRSFHRFLTVAPGVLKAFVTSNPNSLIEPQTFKVFTDSYCPIELDDLSVDQVVACLNDESWYLGEITDVYQHDQLNPNVEVRFFTRLQQTLSFSTVVNKEDRRFISIEEIVCVVPNVRSEETGTQRRRTKTLYLTDKALSKIIQSFSAKTK